MSLPDLYPPMRGIANLPWYTLLGGLRHSSANSLISGTALTASATIHTKGAWAQVIASTADECVLMAVNVGAIRILNTETSTLLDLATGASGSEVAFAENIAVGGASPGNTFDIGTVMLLPIRIPASTRIAARIQGLRASQTANVVMQLYSGPAPYLLPTKLDVLGTSTATSRGTAMSGASGSYVEITASTARRYRAICIVPSVPTSNITTARVVTYTVGRGTAGSEIALGGVPVFYDTLERCSVHPLGISTIACDVPAGSRLAVSHNLPNNPGEFSCCLIGVP